MAAARGVHAQPDLSYDLYKDFPRRRTVKRPLRIAILTREPDNYSSQRLRDAAEARGHVAEMIDTSVESPAPPDSAIEKNHPSTTATTREITIIGMPMVWQARLIGFW